MATKPKAPTPEPVGVITRLRKAHPWFDMLAEKSKEEAIERRRMDERAKGPLLSPKALAALAYELEIIQRHLNPLEKRRKEILEKLLPHWGHTGIEEIESALGKILISTSFELGVDPDIVRKGVGREIWEKVTARKLQPLPLLAEGKDAMKVRGAIAKALIAKPKISVTPPSSRRPKSGGADEIEGEAA